MNEIINNLYLGNVQDAQQILNSGGFYILSIGSEFLSSSKEGMIHIPLSNKTNSKQYIIELWDNQPNMIVKILRTSWKFIDEGLENGPVLVHCMAGKSRSVSVVWSYLMYLGYQPVEAYKIIKKARPIVAPSKVFFAEILRAFRYSQEDDILSQIIP